jgi:predicted HAD superfamily Cof-like phosphohydrolase
MKAMSEELMRAAAMNGKNVPLLRLQLIQEELSELAEAMAKGDLVACLDALVDLRYVLDGTTLALGLQHHFLPGLEEVHRSNMSKLVDGKPVKNEAGRVVKGENYSPPNLKSILEKAL